MKRRYIRVRVVSDPDPVSVAGIQVVEVTTGRRVPEIPLTYAGAFLSARPGDRIMASIWSAPPRLTHRRRGKRRVWSEPVLFRVVSSEVGPR